MLNLKANNTTYRVVGRYMNGKTVSTYCIANDNGNTAEVSRNRLIYMIGEGLITNVRAQISNNEVILHGKGINMNELPIIQRKEEVGNRDRLKQLKIVGRIMYNTSCVGYKVADVSGKQFMLSRKKVVELARQGLIVNVEVRMCNGKYLLRGIGIKQREFTNTYIDKDKHIIAVR